VIGNIAYVQEVQKGEETFVMKEKCCCVTGHRNIPEGKLAYVEEELRKAVRLAIADGFTRFISGFAEGVDLLFATIVAEEKEKDPRLYLEAAIPYAARVKSKNPLFQKMLASCNAVNILCEKYSKSSFFIRNRYMVAESDRVIAVCDGRETGGTLFSMRYAHTQGKEVEVINI